MVHVTRLLTSAILLAVTALVGFTGCASNESDVHVGVIRAVEGTQVVLCTDNGVEQRLTLDPDIEYPGFGLTHLREHASDGWAVEVRASLEGVALEFQDADRDKVIAGCS